MFSAAKPSGVVDSVALCVCHTLTDGQATPRQRKQRETTAPVDEGKESVYEEEQHKYGEKEIWHRETKGKEGGNGGIDMKKHADDHRWFRGDVRCENMQHM